METDPDQTLWQKVRKPRAHYEGDERRAPDPPDWKAYLPLALAILAGVSGYVRMQASVETLQRDLQRQEDTHKEDMTSYLGWNKSISERLRELERR